MAGDAERSKNILIFADGTGQAGGLRPDQRLSNIYKLFRAARPGPESPIDPAHQLAFYDAGLGTDVDSGHVPFRFLRLLRKFASSAMGTGISINIVECYAAILKHYEPGDRVYLFGFSRGAYTARCVAGVLNLCGVPIHTRDGKPIPRYGRALMHIAREAVTDVYEHGAGKDRAKYEPEREEKARRFRKEHGSDAAGESNVAPYFIGVFDTVAALGAKGPRRILIILLLAVVAVVIPCMILYWIGRGPYVVPYVAGLALLAIYQRFKLRFKHIRDFPEKGNCSWHFAGWRSGFYDRFLSKRVRFARHAIAIDERRADFARVQWDVKGGLVPQVPGEPEWLQQVWFAGCHSDIGGSYDEDESRLSDIALGWMVEQAAALPQPVLIDRSRLNLFPSAAGMQHCEIQQMVDRYPDWVPGWMRWTWGAEPRIHARGAPIHPTVLERFALSAVRHCGEAKPYRPSTLALDERLANYFEPAGPAVDPGSTRA